MKKLKAFADRILPKNKFVRSVGILMGGSVGAQAITVLAAPVLTRLYSPADFGLLAIYSVLLAVITVIVSLRYELAIPLPEDDREAAAVLVLSLLIVLGITTLSTIIVFCFKDQITHLLNIPALATYLWLLPVGVLLIGTYQAFSYWSIRTKAFSLLARTKMTQSISSVSVQLAGHNLGPIALLLGQVASQAAGVTSLANAGLKHQWALFRSIRIIDLVSQLNRYRRFPIYDIWGGFFNTAGIQLPPLLFAILFSPAAAGIYALTQRVLSMPMSLVGQAVSQVFFSSATEAYHSKQLAPLVATIHDRLAHIAMPPTLVLIVAGPELFSWIFGSNWREAGIFAQWMAPWLYMVFITSPLSVLYPVMEKQRQGMLFQLLLLSTRVTTLLIGAWIGELIWAVTLFALGSTVCWLGFLIWIARASGNSLNIIWHSTLTSLAWGFALISPMMGLKFISVHSWLWPTVLALTGALIGTRYFFVLIKMA